MTGKVVLQRKYLSVDDIYNEYLPVSKKRIRMLIKRYIPYKLIGGRIFVERSPLENVLAGHSELPLAS